MRALDERAGDDGAVLQHVVEVDEVAVVHVLREVVRVVEVDDALLVGAYHLCWQQLAHGEVLGDLAGHVVALDGDHRGVLVGVLLLDLLVVALNKREDLVVGGVLLALPGLDVAINNVMTGHGKVVEGHQLVLDEVLDLLDGHGVAGGLAGVHDVCGGKLDAALGEALLLGDLAAGGADGVLDLGRVKGDLRAIALDDLHRCSRPSQKSSASAGAPQIVPLVVFVSTMPQPVVLGLCFLPQILLKRGLTCLLARG